MHSPADIQIKEPTEATDEKLSRLRALLSSFDRVAVTYSGGVDSAFLLKVAHDVLPEKTIAITGRSSSLMSEELEEAIALAESIGVQHEIVETYEMDRPGYVQNESDRCYHCKTELFKVAAANAPKDAVVVDGFNADDFSDHRPGHAAAAEAGVRHPLAEVGLTKPEIRGLSRRMGLATWKKPQLACLSSRLPYGLFVTEERLSKVGGVESALRRLGFFDLRARLVKENDNMVRLELGEEEIAKAVEPDIRQKIVEAAKAAGFSYVTLDLEGFATGRLNQDLVQITSPKPL